VFQESFALACSKHSGHQDCPAHDGVGGVYAARKKIDEVLGLSELLDSLVSERDQLRSEVRQAQASQNWRPVTEKPSDDDCSECNSHFLVVASVNSELAIKIAYFNRYYGFWDVPGIDGGVDGAVTHWMQLPLLPGSVSDRGLAANKCRQESIEAKLRSKLDKLIKAADMPCNSDDNFLRGECIGQIKVIEEVLGILNIPDEPSGESCE